VLSWINWNLCQVLFHCKLSYAFAGRLWAFSRWHVWLHLLGGMGLLWDFAAETTTITLYKRCN